MKSSQIKILTSGMDERATPRPPFHNNYCWKSTFSRLVLRLNRISSLSGEFGVLRLTFIRFCSSCLYLQQVGKVVYLKKKK